MATEPIVPPLLTSRETAKTLAICEKSLFNLTRRGELRAIRIGRAVRYSVSDLQAFIDRAKGGAS